MGVLDAPSLTLGAGDQRYQQTIIVSVPGALGNAADTAAVQDAIDANPGKTIFVRGDLTLTDTLTVTADRTQLGGDGTWSVSSMTNKPMVRFADVDYAKMLPGPYFDPEWATGVTALDLPGAYLGEFTVIGDRLPVGMVLDCSSSDVAQRSGQNKLWLTVRNGIRGLVFKGKPGQQSSNNRIERIVWWGASGQTSVGIDCQAYADNNVVFDGYLFLNDASHIGVAWNTDDPTNDVEVYENHIENLIIESNTAGATAILGNRTMGTVGQWTTRVGVRLSGGQTPVMTINAGCDVKYVNSNVNGRMLNTDSASTTQIDSRNYSLPLDGTTDSRPMVLAMIADAVAAGGAELYFAPDAASYYISQWPTLPAGVSIAAQRKTRLVSDGTSSLILSGQNTIHDVTLASTAPHSAVMIAVAPDATDITIHNSTIDGGPNYTNAFRHAAMGTSGFRFSDNEFKNVGYGILFDYQGCDVTGIIIHGNRFKGVFNDAIELNWPYSHWVNGTGGSDFSIVGNHVTAEVGIGYGTTSGFGIGIAAARSGTVIGNTCVNCRYQAIHIEDHSSNIVVQGNTIDTTGGGTNTTGNSGINLAWSTNIAILGNTILNTLVNGINLDYTTGQVSAQITIKGNTITAAGNRGIQVGGDGAPLDTIIEGNTITGCVSHGISLSGSAWNVRVADNIVTGNGGWGLFIGTAGKNGVSVGRNTMIGNTLGVMSYAYTAGKPLPVQDFTDRFVKTEGAANYGIPLFDYLLLGRAADGIMSISAAQGGNFATHIYKLRWDNATLIATRLSSDSTGTVTIIKPMMNGKYLQIGVLDAGGPAAVTFTIHFQGTIYYDNATGTTGTPVPSFSEPKVIVANAAPTAGTWALGDICINTTSSPTFWRCTTAGSPGVWTAVTAASSATSGGAVSSADRGWLGQTGKGVDAGIMTTTIGPASGQLMLCRAKMENDGTIGHVLFYVSTAAAGLTVNKVGIFDLSGNLLAVSADLGATLSTGTQNIAMAAPTVSLVNGTTVLVAVLQVGTTPAKLATYGTQILANVGLTASGGYDFSSLSGQTDMPSTISLSSTTAGTSLTAWMAIAA